MSIESAASFLKCLQEDAQLRETLADKFLEIEKTAREQVMSAIQAAGYDFTPDELDQAQQANLEKLSVLIRMMPDSRFGRMGLIGLDTDFGILRGGGMALLGLMRGGG